MSLQPEDARFLIHQHISLAPSISQTMAAIFRRPTRLVTILAGLTCFYLLVLFLPEVGPAADNLYGFKYVKTSYDWSQAKQWHPAPDPIASLPKGKPKRLPKVQYDFPRRMDSAQSATMLTRRDEVKKAFLKSWNSYKEKAWMYDELTPISGGGKDTFGGWAATLVDALDTLHIMGLKDEFIEALASVATIDFAKTEESACNIFETTIRHLGGLLSAYDLSGERVLLEKAIELGDMLFMSFDTPNRMPPFWLNFDDAKEGKLLGGYHDPSAAVASLSMEFTRLAQLTGEDKYYDAIDRISRVLEEYQFTTKIPGMWPTFFNMYDKQVDAENQFTLGALADSLYEYLPKMFILLGGLEPMYEKLYRGAMEAVVKNILFRPMLPNKDDILFSGSATVSTISGTETMPEGQHLACFVGGLFGLGGKTFNIPEHVTVGEKLARGCAWGYDAFPTGILPEIFTMFACPTFDPCDWDEQQWQEKSMGRAPHGFRNARDPRYILRPEAIESVFLLYRMTGNQEYQEMAWRMFQSIKKATETDIAFAAIQDVQVTGLTTKDDSMESFWLAETLKYFYLVFSPPDLISLDDYVFNTEAHPFRRPK